MRPRRDPVGLKSPPTGCLGAGAAAEGDAVLDRWIESVRSWAGNREDVIGVLLVGSYARGVPTPSSDIDFVVLVSEVGPYLLDHGWARTFGVVTREEYEDWGQVRSLRVWYEGGVEIEWGLTTLAWVGDPLDPGTRRVLRDGYRIIFDRDGVLSSRLASFDHKDV